MKPYKIKPFTSEKKLRYESHLGKFISKAEADRYEILLQMQAQGSISNLQKHISFTLIDAVYNLKYERKVLKIKTKIVKKPVCVENAVTFDVSFAYLNKKGKIRVEVVKSSKDYLDPTYIIKRKLMRYLHQIVVIEN